MKKLQFYGFEHTAIYHGPTGSWKVGDTRAVGTGGIPAEDAKYLVDTFPGAFGPPGKHPTPTEESNNGSSTPTGLAVLDLSIAKLAEALATGDHDHVLAELLKAEEDGNTRKGAVTAIKSRIAAV